MIVNNAPQGTTEWYGARAGRITGSMFKLVRERLKSGPNKGGYTKSGLDYAFRLAVERISGMPLDEGFETWAMRRGKELEPEARALLSDHLGADIRECGFVTTDCARFGVSADGLIDDRKAGVEIKCLVSPERIREIVLEADAAEFMDQMQGGLWVTGLQRWYFALYCPALAGVNRELTVFVVERDER